MTSASRLISAALLSSSMLPLLPLSTCDQEVWEKDVSNDVYIEASREGFERVLLECEEDAMRVKVELEEDFDGVFYTRGSYSEAKQPCYLDAVGGTTEAELRIPYGECKTKSEGDLGSKKTNVVIVQYDDWLIFPGDNAFEISCTKEEESWTASIGLADPDPSAKELPKHRKSTVFSLNRAEFTPGDIRPKKKSKKQKKGKKNSAKSKDEL